MAASRMMSERQSPSVLGATFLHLPGIGRRTELRLWREGVRSWGELLAARSLLGKALYERIKPEVDRSFAAFAERDAAFFASRIPRADWWRIAGDFFSEALFLDIETTGLSLYYDDITLVGWRYEEQYGVTVGLQRERLQRLLRRAKVLVTFNGSHFDVPFIKKQAPGLTFPVVHVDLRYLARRSGISGGQKFLEGALNLRRPKIVESIDGREAADLWRLYQRGNREALRKLVGYNSADVDGMVLILGRLSNSLLQASEAPIRSLPRGSADARRRSIRVHTLMRVPKFQGALGPRVRHSDLPHLNPRETVVGIDLSGSEQKPTGWALLSGTNAETSVVFTDEEIVQRTLASGSRLVSIDAPLSMPEGRSRVTDDDPARWSAGIMRECERELRRRGVAVYPCLIRSMQTLTSRGIRLATLFRSRGLDVIESFPGAMQDILVIPRKREGLMWLALGLREYGIRGELDSCTHDELDAISCAVVGQMYRCGWYEALGAEHEGLLIVPSDLSKGPSSSSLLRRRA